MSGRNKFKWVLALLVMMFLAFPILTSAFTTLSISPIDFESNDPYLNGRAFLLSVVEDGSSQYAVGTISAQNIKADGYQAQNDLKIETQMNQHRCEYGLFESDNIPIYKFSYTKNRYAYYKVNEDTDDIVKQCKSQQGYAIHFRIPALDNSGNTLVDILGYALNDFYCVTAQFHGLKGTIATPFTKTSTDIMLTSHGETKKGTISNAGDRSLTLSNIAYAKWTGNLVTGESCPNLESEGYTIAHDTSGQWRLVSNANYQEYLRKEDNTWDAIETIVYANIGDRSFYTNSFTSAVNQQNLAVDKALQQASYRKTTQITSNLLNNGQMVMELSKLIQFPVITMHVNADWLGIVVPVGEPKIIDVKSSVFREGQEGSIDVTLKNNGNVKASFSVSASCEAPFQMVRASTTISGVGAGETRTASLPITATTNEEVSKTCTITVHDLENSNKRDSATVTVRVTPLSVCTAGTKTCEGETALICNSQGSAYVQDTQEPLRCVKDPSNVKKLQQECEKQGGKLVEKTKETGLIFKDTETSYVCRIPRTPIIAVVMIIAGFVILGIMTFTGGIANIPLWVIVGSLELIGWIWLAIGRAGL